VNVGRKALDTIDLWLLKRPRLVWFTSYRRTSEVPSNLTPLPRTSGPLSLRSHETSGSVGSHRLRKKRLESAASRSVSIRCAEACAGRAVGPVARTAEVCCGVSYPSRTSMEKMPNRFIKSVRSAHPTAQVRCTCAALNSWRWASLSVASIISKFKSIIPCTSLELQ
jgi:hypothetical protein